MEAMDCESGHFSGRPRNPLKKIHREFTQGNAVIFGKNTYREADRVIKGMWHK